jgi:K+-transporting ATPase ATPase C chain
MFSHLRSALVILGLMTVLTGLVYPLALTGLAQLAMPHQANGSLVQRADKTVGSELIGQEFTDPRWFWSRPSATTPKPYDASSSSGSNLGPRNPALVEAAKKRVDALRATAPGDALIPIDLVTSSGSGLDPHVSPAAAFWQVPRVAKARGLEIARVRALVEAHVEPPWLRLFGENRVNVLKLNLALQEIH